MPSPNIFVCAYFKEGACHADRESSYDERSKTNSTIKSSCGKWTNGSVRGGVHEVTHRCETMR